MTVKVACLTTIFGEDGERARDYCYRKTYMSYGG